MQQPAPQDQATMIYRIEALERLFHELQTQLQQYVRSSENNLHLQTIKETVMRIEAELGLAKKQLTESNDKMVEQFASLREEQNRMQIRSLVYIVGTIVTFISLALVGIISSYATHILR
jgi:TolA-binding protein